MKSPKQWQQELAGKPSIKSIKAIQIDARIDGLLEAAAIIGSLEGDDVFEPIEAIQRRAMKLRGKK